MELRDGWILTQIFVKKPGAWLLRQELKHVPRWTSIAIGTHDPFTRRRKVWITLGDGRNFPDMKEYSLGIGTSRTSSC